MEVEPKRITDLFVRKKLGSKHADINDANQEETRMKNLNTFDPRIKSHRTITSDDVSGLIRNIQLINEELVLIKSIESLSITSKKTINLPLLKIENIMFYIKTKKTSKAELVQIFIQELNLSAQVIENFIILKKLLENNHENQFGTKLEVAD